MVWFCLLNRVSLVRGKYGKMNVWCMWTVQLGNRDYCSNINGVAPVQQFMPGLRGAPSELFCRSASMYVLAVRERVRALESKWVESANKYKTTEGGRDGVCGVA